MRRLTVVVVALLGCASVPPGGHANGGGGASLRCETGAATAAIDGDLGAMLGGGNAMAEHIGPDAARELLARVDAEPDRYLDQFECRFLPARAPVDGEESLLLPVVLGVFMEHDPVRVRALASRLLDRYAELERRVPPAARDESWSARLEDRRRELEAIRAFGAARFEDVWPATPPAIDGFCATESPVRLAPVLRLSTCNCGEEVACRASSHGDEVRLDVRANPNAAGACRDCRRASAYCWLPDLEAEHTYRVTIGGHEIGTLPTDVYARPANRCP